MDGFLLGLSNYIKKIPLVKEVMLFIGKRTLTIVVLHFLCFKFVAVLVVCYYQMPLFCVAAFPNLYGARKMWWIVYTCAGTVIPLMFDILYKSVRSKIKTNMF